MKIVRKTFLIPILLLILFSLSYSLTRTKISSNRNPLINIKKYIPDAVIDMRYSTKNNFMKTVLDGYKKNYCMVKPKTALALRRVYEYLKKHGYGLKFFDCYRPLRAVKHMIRWTKKNHPKWLGVYVGSRVNLNVKFGHSSGNTIDLTLIDLKTGKAVNMGTEFDDFRKIAWTKNAGGKILRNRMILFNAMKKFGFENFYSEWWHYSYKNDPGMPMDFVIK